MSWSLLYSRAANKDAVLIKRAGLKDKVDSLLDILEMNPFSPVPPYERLVGDLVGFYSRRINIHHRLVYRVDKAAKRVFIERLWSHYE